LQVQIDRFDPLWDGREVRALAGFVGATRADERGVALGDLGGERAAGVALVAEQRFTSVALAAVEQHESDFALVALGRGQFERPRGAAGAKIAGKPEFPE
jgi:hypothetical protein